MPYRPTVPNLFGQQMGAALAGGAESIAGGLQRKYEAQRQLAQQNKALQMTFASRGIEYAPNDPESLDRAMAQFRQMSQSGMELSNAKTQAEMDRIKFQSTPAGAMGGMVPGGGYDFLTGPGGIQYVPTKYGPRFVPPEPIAINPSTGEQIVLPRGGKFVEPSGSAAAKLTLSKINAFAKSINELEQVLSTVPSGRIAGGGAKVLNTYTGIFPQVRTSESLSGLMTPMATRLIGGDVGNLSETEQKAARTALHLTNATTEERKQVIGLLRTLLKDKEKEAKQIVTGRSGAWNQPGQNDSPDLESGQNDSPDLESAETRYEELEAAGMSQSDIYAQLTTEGF